MAIDKEANEMQNSTDETDIGLILPTYFRTIYTPNMICKSPDMQQIFKIINNIISARCDIIIVDNKQIKTNRAVSGSAHIV